ncbi:MAG TPA: class I adenylate-forming enzyme family protein [Acetobacteraceae bacterium]|jgi:acyl-CoA synthetase (AMP-forming)/AMP-acid ligase II
MRCTALTTTAQHIAWHARHSPDATAVTEHGTRISYRTLAIDLLRCVQALEEFGIGPGMLCATEAPQRYRHLLLMLAGEIIGAAVIAMSREDLAADNDVLRACDALVTATTPVRAPVPRTLAMPPEWPPGPAEPWHDDAPFARLQRPIAPDTVTLITRTSGTTGRPKAMPMTHATQQLRIARNIERVAHDILPNPRFLCLYRLNVGSVYLRVLGILQSAGTVVFTGREHVHGLIAAGAVNYAVFTLGDAEHLIRGASLPPEGHRLHVETFGAALGPALRQQIRARLTPHYTSKYSSNETNPVSIVDDDNVGTLCPGVAVRIVDDAGADVPQGEVGRIRVRSPTMVHGYFNDPELTSACFIDGWFQTSDIGSMPAPDKLIVLGRIDDMLNVGGVKIARLPLEDALKRIAGVADAAVFCIAGANAVGRLLAAVELRTEHSPDDTLRRIGDELVRHTRYFDIMPLPWFPRSESGKVRRRDIEAAWAGRQPALHP